MSLSTINTFKKALPIFSTLSDENRQKIIVILAEGPEFGMTVNAITDKINLSRPAVSHHLKSLKQTGLVDVEKRGVENYYYITLKEAVNILEDLLDKIKKECTRI